MVRAWQAQERAAARTAAGERLPFPLTQLVQLFEYVDTRWNYGGCDHTLRYTIQYLVSLGLSQDKQRDVMSWLREQGGACDCEILANVVEDWVDNFEPEEWHYTGD